MVKEIVAVLIALALWSFICELAELLRPRVKSPTATEPRGNLLLTTLLGRKPAPPESKRPEVSSIARSVGSWRKQKADLERQHNSQQRERDRRVAPQL